MLLVSYNQAMKGGMLINNGILLNIVCDNKKAPVKLKRTVVCHRMIIIDICKKTFKLLNQQSFKNTFCGLTNIFTESTNLLLSRCLEADSLWSLWETPDSSDCAICGTIPFGILLNWFILFCITERKEGESEDIFYTCFCCSLFYVLMIFY